MYLHQARLALAALFALGLVAVADEKKDEEKGSIGIVVQPDEGAGTVVVAQVFKNSPAEKAGVKVGDTILKMDGKEIKKPEDGGPIMAGKKPGDKVKLTIKRDGKEMEIEVTAGKRSEVLPPDIDEKKPKDKDKS